jgi:signal transduction histidine kinase
MLILARPNGRGWWPWSAVAVAVLIAAWPAGEDTGREQLKAQLEDHCRRMLAAGEELATDETLLRLLGASGEAVDPAHPFSVLDRSARREPGRTIYLADDRGRVIAWGGVGATFPDRLRPLGQRQWGVAWSAGGAHLWLRDPLLIEGRIVGAVILSDRAPLSGPSIWGMRAGRSRELVLGVQRDDTVTVAAAAAPGVAVPVAVISVDGWKRSEMRWAGWLLLAAIAIAFEPWMAAPAVVAGGASLLAAVGTPSPFAFAVLVLLSGCALGRMTTVVEARWSRAIVVTALTGASLLAVFGTPLGRFDWLPAHLLRPGWGGVWMVALAWLLSGWPFGDGASITLARRLRVAALLALLALAVHAVRLPVELEARVGEGSHVVLPRGDLQLDELLPAPPVECRLTDLAPTLADRWRLGEWRTPSELVLIDETGFEVSRWGDLAAAGESVRVVRQWDFEGASPAFLELSVATEPWSVLGDWRTEAAVEDARRSPVWFAALTRSGEVAASLHPEIRGLDPERAGELFHAGGGWARVNIGDDRRLARVERRGQWLVLAAAHHASVGDWVLRSAIALLWALLGAAIAKPPMMGRQYLSTFGGRLRLLVAGGVVLPLAIMTLFVHQRISTQELRLERNRGLDALQAARYTAVHLGGGFAVNDQLARWLADGWGGEVTLWDGIWSVAASRPDLVISGALPQLPLSATVPPFLLGKDDSTVLRWRNRLVAAGPVDLQRNRFLLHLYRSDPVRTGADLGAVDWLLTGALLSALLALVLTNQVEQRLSTSLRELVALSRKLLDGEPVGELRRPRETDLAEVLDAVRSMNEEVQRRELRLRYQEELLRITLKTLEPAVVVLEPDGSERFANPSAVRYQEEYGEMFLEQLRHVVDEASIGGSAAKTVQPQPGSDLTWRIGVAGVPFPDGALGLVAVVDDVTDLVRADRVQQLNQLARIVAHEIKNPLTPIRLWTQELEAAINKGDRDLPALTREACREIAVQVERLRETANSFSNLVALESWEPEPVDLAGLVAEVPSGGEVLARRGILITREIELAPPVSGDRQWLRRALANLLQNSLDALAGQPGTIVLRLRSEGERVVLEVEDSGGGVPEARMPDLFTPHFSTTTAGSGLGLALVNQVVTRCHGSVSAANGEHGLKVRLEFPTSRSLRREVSAE